jgi:hypothetical protein
MRLAFLEKLLLQISQFTALFSLIAEAIPLSFDILFANYNNFQKNKKSSNGLILTKDIKALNEIDLFIINRIRM